MRTRLPGLPSPLWARALPLSIRGLGKAGSECSQGRLCSQGLWTDRGPAGWGLVLGPPGARHTGLHSSLCPGTLCCQSVLGRVDMPTWQPHPQPLRPGAVHSTIHGQRAAGGPAPPPYCLHLESHCALTLCVLLEVSGWSQFTSAPTSFRPCPPAVTSPTARASVSPGGPPRDLWAPYECSERTLSLPTRPFRPKAGVSPLHHV